MKRLILLTLTVFAAAGCRSSGKKAEEAAAADFQIRPYQTQTLPNGLTVIWVPDDSLPYVSMQLMLKTGSSQDPIGKEGVAAFTASLLDKGTRRRNALQISEDLEQIGSGFDADVQPDYMVMSSSSLSFNRDNVLSQFGEILLQPSFPQKELERERKNVLAGMKKLADRPEDFTEYLMPGFLFGRHPYGHGASGTPASIRKLKREDVSGFYARYFHPSNAILAVTGQFDAAWKKKVADTFGAWKKAKEVPEHIPDFPKWKGLELLLVDRSDLNQAQIQIGFRGVPRKIPEYMELRAALKILGESFGSRLFNEIRAKRGLTYSIYSWFDPRLKSGPMGISTFTRVEKVGETVRETLNTYRQFVNDGVTDDEVRTVKALMRGQFPRTFETPESLARQLLILDRYGIGADYLTNYYHHLDAINRDSINATIHKYFDPENLRILVYAPRKNTESVLKTMGKLEIKDYRDYLQ